MRSEEEIREMKIQCGGNVLLADSEKEEASWDGAFKALEWVLGEEE